MPVVRRLLLAVTVTALAVGAGVALRDSGSPPEEPEATSTPLESFDTTGVAVLRTAFCDRVPDDAVAEALGEEPEDATEHGNGDRIRLAPGVRDRTHEYGCSWSAGGVTASAWVFAPPVPRPVAADLLRRARAPERCAALPDAPAYGDPSVGLVCTTERGREVSFRGLFGDAWLACSLRATGVSAGESVDDSADRTGRWCVAVARAASAEVT